MKLSSLLSLLLITIFQFAHFVQAQEKGIQFFQENWEEALTASWEEGKLIYVDCYTSWCGPCKRMEANVFTDPEVAKFYNEQFINIRMDMESKQGKKLAVQYDVNVYPTHLYLDGKGETLHRSTSYKTPTAFVELGKEALDPERRTKMLETIYQEGRRDLSFMKEYLKYRKKTRQSYQEIFDAYLPEIAEIEISERINFLRKYTQTVESKSFVALTEHKGAICLSSSEMEYQFLIKEIIKKDLKAAAIHKDEKLYANAKRVYQANFSKQDDTEWQELNLTYLKSAGRFAAYYDSLKTNLEKTILEGESIDQISQAIKQNPDSVFFHSTKDEMIISYFGEKGKGTMNMADWTKEDGLVAIEYYNGTAGILTHQALQFINMPDSFNYLIPEVIKWVELSLSIEKNYQDEFAGKYFYYEAYAKLAHKNKQFELAKEYALKAIDHAKKRHFPEEDFEGMAEMKKKL